MHEQIIEELYTNLSLYARENLKIKPKTGPLIPLILNKAQAYLHERAEAQKKRTGKVRIIVLKGRQQGLSTYIAARFYHQTTCQPGVLTFVFAHAAEGTESLYSMVNRFYENSDSMLQPARGKSNAKELLFPRLQSGYKVGTAGTGKGLGRSKTFQQLHWSEVAYSPGADDHSAGILQTVADMAGTEIFLESTSAGMGDFFHRACKKAQAGVVDDNGAFELVFIPWFWQDEYKRKVDDAFKLEQQLDGQDYTSEQEYFDMFKKQGLTFEHLAWRRAKINDDFQGDVSRFMREYPFYPEEAFEATANDCYIKPLLVRKARSTQVINTSAPLIMGADPARLGGNQFKLCHRKGRNVTKIGVLPPGDTVRTSQMLAQEINKYKPVRVNIDCGGLGVAVYDNLVNMGYGNIVRKVDFGGAANNADRYKNKRAEMYGKALMWFEDSPCSISCDEKEADKLQAELAVVGAKWVNNSQLLMQPKEEIKKELGYSPDTADCFVLTFADEVANPDMLVHARPKETFIADTNWSPFS